MIEAVKNYSLILKPVPRRTLVVLLLGYATLFPVTGITQTNNLHADEPTEEQIVAAIPNGGVLQMSDLFKKI